MPEGKIVKALSGFYYVFSDNKVIQCRSRGVFRKNKINPLVGDEVVFQAENDLEGYILEVKERKNEPRHGRQLQMLIKPFWCFLQ